MSAYLNQ